MNLPRQISIIVSYIYKTFSQFAITVIDSSLHYHLLSGTIFDYTYQQQISYELFLKM